MKINNFILKTVVLFFMFAVSVEVLSANYYVDASAGDDLNNGVTPTTAWKTIYKVNSISFNPGDSIFFKRGEVWREQLTPYSGTTSGCITYGAYGNLWDSKPLILGSTQRNNSSDWTNNGENIWSTTME